MEMDGVLAYPAVLDSFLLKKITLTVKPPYKSIMTAIL